MNHTTDDTRRSAPLVCFGGANMDLHIQSSVPVIFHDSTPGKIHTSPGGVMRNIAENCARLGADVTLLSAVGNDAFGDRIVKMSEAAGIRMDRVLVREDCPTSCYMAFMDQTGDMLVAANDMRIMDLIPDDQGGNDYYLNGSYNKLQDAGAAYNLNQPQEDAQPDTEEQDEPDENPDEETDGRFLRKKRRKKYKNGGM